VTFLGGTPEEDSRALRGRRPGAAAAHRVPALCVHGAADATVPLEQSERYAAAAGALDDRVEVTVVLR
jgi:pimeloyl-ACP methyl ester carboxylesterase